MMFYCDIIPIELKYFIFVLLVTAKFIVVKKKSVFAIKFTQMLYRFLEIKLWAILAPLPNHMT